MFFSEINAIISIFSKAKQFAGIIFKSKISEKESEETIANRVFRVFETHGIHKNQIPRFCDLELTLADVQNEQALLKRLDEEFITFICRKFAISREWLDGASKQIYFIHDFYQEPESFITFLDDLLEKNSKGRISGVLLTSGEKNHNTVLLFQEELCQMETKSIYRYHLCDVSVFHYWKSRAYTTALVAYAWRKKVFVKGLYLPQKEIDKIASGEYLLGWSGEGVWSLRGKRWYPEDMSINPNSYLDGVDPGEDNFGYKSALGLWLELEKEGYMDSGIKNSVRISFEKKFNELV